MASTKSVAFIALVVLVQCAWIQCQVIGGYPGLYGNGAYNLLNTGCGGDSGSELDMLLPILLLSMVNKNNGGNGGCSCGGGGCGGGCGRC